jgi:hypothetical protein
VERALRYSMRGRFRTTQHDARIDKAIRHAAARRGCHGDLAPRAGDRRRDGTAPQRASALQNRGQAHIYGNRDLFT